ncbi:uncharacterized protein G2W53_003868 [Senna tora]|uniref:Uncharacterized protein n=1 Tax=Senna tora TaxID=362788 RepID=A0A834XAV1_9FABA|nr:uncharacterized protein G2W53_003868 [Senna tora]
MTKVIRQKARLSIKKCLLPKKHYGKKHSHPANSPIRGNTKVPNYKDLGHPKSLHKEALSKKSQLIRPSVTPKSPHQDALSQEVPVYKTTR